MQNNVNLYGLLKRGSGDGGNNKCLNIHSGLGELYHYVSRSRILEPGGVNCSCGETEITPKQSDT